MAPSTFVMALPRFDLGLPLRDATAMVVGLVECLLGASVASPEGFGGPLASSITYALFAGIMERARRNNDSADCGCFGALPARIDATAVARSGLLAVAALGLAIGRAAHAMAPYPVLTGVAVTVVMLIAAGTVDTFIAVSRSRGRTG